MNRLRTRGSSFMGSLAAMQLRRKALKSAAAVEDTFLLTKDIFERHRVVFTVGTSIASVATACAGYSIRHFHDTKVDQRLESIECALKVHDHVDPGEFKKLINTGTTSTASCIATAGTTLLIGYALGWRSGSWYRNRKLRQEQMKLLAQMKPKRWQILGRLKRPTWWQEFQFPRRPSLISLRQRLMKSARTEHDS